MPEYNVTLTQNTGATLLLRVSPNEYTDYSVDGNIWYPLGGSTHGTNTPNTSNIVVDNVSIKVVDGVLTATQELPDGGSVGDVLTLTDGGVSWGVVKVSNISYGKGITVDPDTGVVSVTRPVPPGGKEGQVLTIINDTCSWGYLDDGTKFLLTVIDDDSNDRDITHNVHPDQWKVEYLDIVDCGNADTLVINIEQEALQKGKTRYSELWVDTTKLGRKLKLVANGRISLGVNGTTDTSDNYLQCGVNKLGVTCVSPDTVFINILAHWGDISVSSEN